MDHLSAAAVDAWSIYPSREPLREEADVFRALGDPSRRLLLDSLFASDGQTLGELSAQLPEMTRFGVMKHLRILEAAGLVASRKIGRERLHYLNPVPIRMIHDRWIGKYAEASAAARRRVSEIYIRTTPERLWQAIREHELVLAGALVDAEPLRRLVMTWPVRRNTRYGDDRPSRVTWQIEPRGDACKLTVLHDEFPSNSAGSDWPLVLSSLKSSLETGEGLTFEQH